MFKKYIYSRRRAVMFFVISAALFALSFFLYGIPIKAVIYPATLAICAGVPFLASGYFKEKRLHDELEEIKKLGPGDICALPESEYPEAEDYGEIIEGLRESLKEAGDAYSERERETVDYYTAWVHQIKTPIAAMRLTLQNEETPVSRRLLSELSRIESYVGMVLTYLRLGSDSSDYVFKEQDLDMLIKQTVRKFAPEFIDRKLRLDYEPIGRKIVTDEKWFSFVLEQLFSNALKYTREGGVSVYCEGDALVIRDTGIGIAPEDLPRIFEKGFTGHNGRTDRKATGIGLYLCREICRRLSIGISAASEPGKGTAVTLDLKQHGVSAD